MDGRMTNADITDTGAGGRKRTFTADAALLSAVSRVTHKDYAGYPRAMAVSPVAVTEEAMEMPTGRCW